MRREYNKRMVFQRPPSSRTAVQNAARAIARGEEQATDLELVQQWRDAHAHILNTFQARLRTGIKKSAKKILFVQRLKRLTTIQNKLRSGRAHFPMNDVAGCRLIFNNESDLREFRTGVHGSRAKHEYISADKYDYIDDPKQTGYRGVHDVFKYVGTGEAADYTGLRVEIQYRTLGQHAWATALETSDAIEKASLKFEGWEGQPRMELFRLASEYIARKESRVGCLPDLSNAEIRSRIYELEGELGTFARLRLLTPEKMVTLRVRKHVVLEFSDALSIQSFDSAKKAMEYRNVRESEDPDLDIVYVRPDGGVDLQSAFRNYFRDASAFLKILDLS